MIDERPCPSCGRRTHRDNVNTVPHHGGHRFLYRHETTDRVACTTEAP